VAEVPGKGRLLEGVRALHDDDAADGRIRERVVQDGAHPKHVGEGEVACRRPSEVDRDDVCGVGQAGDRGQELRARQRGDRAAGDRIDGHADRAPGEDDGNPRSASHGSSGEGPVAERR
jgi:hypothetical protein